MQGNTSNFIPIRKGEKGDTLKRDAMLLSDKFHQELIGITGETHDSTWRKQRKNRYQMDQMNREVTNNIINDPYLSQSHGNPDYYPPVPEYTIPEGKKYTSAKIAHIQMSRDINFIKDNIVVSGIPLPSEDVDNELTGLNKIDPYLLSRTIIHGRNIGIITGYTQTPDCTHSKVTSCIGYMVYIYKDLRTNRIYLSQIYVYDNEKTIHSLLDLLEDLRVENMDDLRNSGRYFVNLLQNK